MWACLLREERGRKQSRGEKEAKKPAKTSHPSTHFDKAKTQGKGQRQDRRTNPLIYTHTQAQAKSNNERKKVLSPPHHSTESHQARNFCFLKHFPAIKSDSAHNGSHPPRLSFFTSMPFFFAFFWVVVYLACLLALHARSTHKYRSDKCLCLSICLSLFPRYVYIVGFLLFSLFIFMALLLSPHAHTIDTASFLHPSPTCRGA